MTQHQAGAAFLTQNRSLFIVSRPAHEAGVSPLGVGPTCNRDLVVVIITHVLRFPEQTQYSVLSTRGVSRYFEGEP